MHGPPPSWFGGRPMEWPSLPSLAVVDTIAPTLKPRKQRKWRANRDEALAQWAAAGFEFDVTEELPETEFDRTYWKNGVPEEVELKRHIIPGCLRLMDGKYINKYIQGVAWSYPDVSGSVVLVQINRVWWQATSPWRRQFVVTHEMGHALGLNHRSDNKSSVMYSVNGMGGNSLVPDLHDIQSLRDYYA